MNKRLILYVHGQGGRAEEASVYEPLFPDCAVKGMVYTATSPWEAREEFPAVFDRMCSSSERITLIANSIGAYFSMEALPQSKLEKAYRFASYTCHRTRDRRLVPKAGIIFREFYKWVKTLSLRYTKAFREMFRDAAEARSERSAMMALQIASSSGARVDRRRCSASCNSVSSAFPSTSANASGVSSSQGLSSPTSFVVV